MEPGVLHVLNDAEQERAEARADRAIKLAIGGFSAVLLITIITSVHVSTLGVSFGTFVFGSDSVWRGHDAAFRVAAYDPHERQLVGPIAAVARIKDDNGVRAEGAGAGTQFAELRLRVPPDLGVKCELEIEVETDDGTDLFTLPLQAVDRAGAAGGRVSPPSEVLSPKARKAGGPYRIDLYPQGGQIVGELENVIFARLTRDGKPLQTRIASETVGVDTLSDAFGLFRFVYTPTPTPLALEVSEGEVTQTVSLPVDTKPSGPLVEIEPDRLAAPGEPVTARVRTGPLQGPVQVDVWAGNSLLLAHSAPPEDGARAVELVLPDSAHGLVRVEAYRNLDASDDTTSSAAFWVSAAAPEKAASEALEFLASLPGGDDPIIGLARAASGERKLRLTDMALSRYAPDRHGPPELRSTLGTRRAALTEKQSTLRASVNALFLLTVAFGILLALGFVVRHQIQVKRAMRGVIDEGVAAGEDIDTEGVERLARVSHLYDLVMALGALVLVAYGIFILLTRMRWG